jgi:GntR family transcriptional regulator, transcriptional repressor for pyruvate dehydrogenase complex
MSATKLAYAEVADRLRGMILAGKLRAGHRLPTEAELRKQFKVGRSTIREALRMLTSERLLTTSRGVGGGSSVARLNHDDVTEMLESAIAVLSHSEGVSVAELLEARELLEVPAARLAAARRTADQLEVIRKTIPASLDTVPMRRIFVVNRAFHEALLDAASNRLMHAMTEPVFKVLGNRFARERAERDFWTVVMSDHRKILTAIEAGDVDGAGKEMHTHLMHLRATYEAIDSMSQKR